jgi:hypothetical protein
MGVVPAWLSRPVTRPFDQIMPLAAVTTPIVAPASSRTGPCSMCSSTIAEKRRSPARSVPA